MQSLHQCEEPEQASVYETSPSLKRAATPFEHDEIKTPKRTRGRTGCLNCRRRRKKCDEAKPDCTKCQSRGEECEWDTGITFRLTGLDPQHPSMLQAKSSKTINQKGLKIVDVQFHNKTSSPNTDKPTHKKQTEKPPSNDDARNLDVSFDIASAEADPVRTSNSDALRTNVNQTGVLCTIPEEPSPTCDSAKVTCESSSGPKCCLFPFEQANPADVVNEADSSNAIIETVFDGDEDMPDYPRSNSDGSTSMPSGPWSTEPSASSVTSISSQTTKLDQARNQTYNDGLTHLDSLDYLMSERPNQPLGPSGSTTLGGRATTAVLEKSRQKLHQHIHDLVNTTRLAHQNSSDTDPDESATALRELKLNGELKFKGIRLVHTPLAARPLGCTKLLKRRQLELWRNYIDNIAPWLDVCSSKRYFQHSLPMLAKSADHLHYAVLALSSRQLENQESSTSNAESIGLHQDAIHLLRPELHTFDTPTIATCVLLCVMESLSSTPSECRISLDCCAGLMDVADINARSGGIRQALFWTFANLAVWNSLSDPNQQPILPTRLFYPSDSLATAINYIRSLVLGDGYAKYTIFLTSAIIDALGLPASKQSLCSRQARHSALTDLLDDWSHCRPEDFQPLMSYPSILDDHHHPFPMVLYPTVPAAVGNLLYHCASILLLQNAPGNMDVTDGEQPNTQKSCSGNAANSTKCKPPELPTGKGLTWHARQICGILSESHDSAVLVHGSRALSVAGKVIGHSDEREAIVALLEKIERETGWKSVRWGTERLRESWGMNGPRAVNAN